MFDRSTRKGNTTRIKKKRRTSKIDDKTFPRNEKQKTKKPFESS